MEFDLTNLAREAIQSEDLEQLATRFRHDLGVQLTEALQSQLNEMLGPDIRVGIRVEVESVSLRKTS